MCRPGLVAVLLCILAGCGSSLGPLESRDIYARQSAHEKVFVKHVLIGWGDLEGNYGGRMDERARARSEADAKKLVERVVSELETGKPIEALMIEHSNDTGTKDGRSLEVTEDANFVRKFKRLALRLEIGEHGVVRTEFGFHVIKRIQ
jgi:hypothetical protein